MKRYRRLPSIEQLEEKRLKAADLANGSAAHGAEVVEAADATPIASAPTNHPLTKKSLEDQTSTPKSKLTAEETDDTDESGDTDATDGDDTNDNGSDDNESDTSDNDSDGSDGDDTDGQDGVGDDNDENDSDGNDDNESDDNDDSDTDTETKFATDLTATTGNQVTTAKADFENDPDGGTAEQDFTLKVSGLTTNGTPVTGTQEVRIGGNLVGTIDLTNGSGKLELSSTGNDGGMPSPMGFPTTVDATTTVEVGPAGAPLLSGTLGTSSNLQNLTLTPQVVSSSPASVFAGESQPVASNHPDSRPLTVGNAATQNGDEAESPDANLLDAGFAAAATTAGSPAHSALHSDDLANQNDSAESRGLDAAFESLVDGELGWTV